MSKSEEVFFSCIYYSGKLSPVMNGDNSRLPSFRHRAQGKFAVKQYIVLRQEVLTKGSRQ